MNELAYKLHAPNYTVLRHGAIQSLCQHRICPSLHLEHSKNKEFRAHWPETWPQTRMCVREIVNDRFACGTTESHFRIRVKLPKRHRSINELLCFLRFLWLDFFLAAGRLLARGGCVQAESRAHALLPRTLLSLACFNLRPDIGQRLAPELAHLDVKKCRHDRD